MREAAYCGTRNVYGDMEAAAKSLVANSAVERVHFVIEDDSFPHPLPDMVTCHNASKQRFFAKGGPNMGTSYSYMALMRMALCHIIDAEVVLSLDCDTICRRDVTPIWDTDLSESYLAAVPEWHRSNNGLQYCNAGVTLFNLGMLRDGKADECIAVLNRRGFTWVDQDVMNYLCQGRIAELPSWWNSCYWTDKGADKNPRIVHYAGKKADDWHGEPDATLYRKMSWGEAMDRHEGMLECAS